MSTNTNDEISLKDFSNFFDKQWDKLKSFAISIFSYFFKYRYILGVLFLIGVVLGYFADKKKSYAQEIIVIPNFSSVDYLYEKIDVFNSKIKEKDSVFFNKYAFKGFKNIKKVEIAPIIDMYKLAQSSEANLEMIKLMTEDISMNDIIEGDINKKAYIYHQITMKTDKKAQNEAIIQPFLNYLNDTEYFQQLQKVAIDNVQKRLKANDSTLVQIDNILNAFAEMTHDSGNKNQLIYYNENTQLNDILISKDNFNYKTGVLKSDLVNYQKVIKDVSVILNKILKRTIPNKVIYPLFFIFLFIAGSSLWHSYKALKQFVK